MAKKQNVENEEKVCPNCGFCPTCKRPKQTFSPYPVYPYPVYPWYWTYPDYQYPNTTYIPLTTGSGTSIDNTTGGSSLGLSSGAISLSRAGNELGPNP